MGAAFLGVFKFLEIEEAQVLGTGCLSPLDCSVSKKVAQVFRALRTKTRSEHRKHLSGYGVNQDLAISMDDIATELVTALRLIRLYLP